MTRTETDPGNDETGTESESGETVENLRRGTQTFKR